jgi:gas vesicle protein
MYHLDNSNKKFLEGILLGAGITAIGAFMFSKKGQELQKEFRHTCKTMKKKALHLAEGLPHFHHSKAKTTSKRRKKRTTPKRRRTSLPK